MMEPRKRWPALVLVVALIGAGVWWKTREASPDAAAKRDAAANRDRPGHRRVDPRLANVLPKVRAGLSVPSVPDGSVLVSGRLRLIEGQGAQLAGAEVVFVGAESEAAAEADADGAYALALAPGEYRMLVRSDQVLTVTEAGRQRIPGLPDARSAGTYDEQLTPRVTIIDDRSGLDLDVMAAARIHGTVRNEAGVAIGGAVVIANGQGPRPTAGTDVATTDDRGMYELIVPASEQAVFATHQDYAGSEPQIAYAAGQRDHTVDLTILQGCVIRGRVVTASGAPAGDGAIERQWGDEDDEFAPAERIAADGTFRVVSFESSDLVLRAWPWHSPPSRGQRFTCGPGRMYRDVVFQLPNQAPDIAGTIVRADGSPVPFAFVDIQPLGDIGFAQQERADGNGHFGVYAMPAARYRVQAYDPYGGFGSMEIDAPIRDAQLKLSGTGSIVGTVRGIRHGTVRLSLGCLEARGDQPRIELAEVVGGSFSVDEVPACAMRVEAQAGDEQEVHVIDVTPAGVTELALGLAPPRKKQITGIVRRPDGSAATGATVIASGTDAEAQTDGNGRYAIEAISGGQLAFADGERYGHTDVSQADVDEEVIDITLRDYVDLDHGHDEPSD